jgi:hypothetical protein
MHSSWLQPCASYKCFLVWMVTFMVLQTSIWIQFHDVVIDTSTMTTIPTTPINSTTTTASNAARTLPITLPIHNSPPVAAVPSPSSFPSYHIVFSTGCSSHQEWQSYVLFYNMMRLNQTGHVTRVASCKDVNDSKLVQGSFQRIIQSMPTSERFHLFITPDFNKQNGTYYKVCEKHANPSIHPSIQQHAVDETTVTSMYVCVCIALASTITILNLTPHNE